MLDKYLDEIGKEQLLTEEQEKELSEQIMNGNRRAVEKLTTANLRFVVSVARKYQNRGVDMADLVSEGNLGLIRAAERYDARQGCRFISYALPFVRKNIERAIAEQTTLYSIPKDETSQFEKKRSKALSADAPLGGRNNVNLLSLLVNNDAPAADCSATDTSFNAAVKSAIEKLNERERQVMTLFFGIDSDKMTLAEIGKKMELKRERIRQIRDKALRKMSKEKVLIEEKPDR